MLLEMELKSGFALESFVTPGAVHLGFGVRWQVSDVRRLDRGFKVALFTSGANVKIILSIGKSLLLGYV